MNGIKRAEKQSDSHGLKLAQFLIINDTFANMALIPFEEYVCRPHPVKKNCFLVSALKASAHVCEPGFVVIPYKNPGANLVSYQCYAINAEMELPVASAKKDVGPHRLKARTNKATYINQVKAIQKEIQLGNVYEMNYCLEFYEENTQLDVFDTFIGLMQRTKAPYTYLVKIGGEYLICCSPELFIKKTGNVLQSKPIKGTIRRGKDEVEDEALKMQLQQSLKERTENVMAVDVARNDLSKIAARGSVSVNSLYHIETFETVHQMVSTVSCQLKPSVALDDIIQAMFPMASMTGAPKTAAMDYIDQFENFKRGLYSGTFGLIDAKGDFEFPVVIRSIYYNATTGYLSLAAGGAITYLSQPEQEYDEIILKLDAQKTVLRATFEI